MNKNLIILIMSVILLFTTIGVTIGLCYYGMEHVHTNNGDIVIFLVWVASMIIMDHVWDRFKELLNGT